MSTLPTAILEQYGLAGCSVAPITAGHINATFAIDAAGKKLVLQRLSKIFGEEIHEDIEAVTRHLALQGMTTPLLVPTRTGALFARDGDGAVFRVFTWVTGETHMKAESPEMCEAAAELLGRFHFALRDLQHTFKNKRGNIHDTARHVAKLEKVLASHAAHDRYGVVEPVCRRILSRLADLPSLTSLPVRVVHGDPKISNVLFEPGGRALCLVDLDTLGPANIAVELGDALRSWCNPVEEDNLESSIDLRFFAGAMRGYLRGSKGLATSAETDMIPIGVETIALELAARFATDALEESYFGWDKKRFSRSSEHNLLRAKSQLTLADSMQSKRAEAMKLVR